MFQKHTLSPDETLCVGIGMVTASLIYLGLVVWRFQWMLQFALVRALLRWGRGRRSFPASRLGAFSGGILLFVLGMMAIDSDFEMLPKLAWLVVLILVLVFVISVAVHDYRSHRRRAACAEGTSVKR